MTDRPRAELRLDDFVVVVLASGYFRDERDLCPACLIEIAKKGNALSPPSKKEGEE
jgi:hypothetical protein